MTAGRNDVPWVDSAARVQVQLHWFHSPRNYIPTDPAMATIRYHNGNTTTAILHNFLFNVANFVTNTESYHKL